MSDERPTFGSLFAGIGGIDLGLERAGWECRFQVEWDPFCQRVLAKHWPDVPRYGDITAVDWSGVERVDLLAGGFPCQPVSSAGRQKAQGDERWLWPEFRRAIGALRPNFVLVENVTNLLAVNDGSAFGDILGDLASIGYDVEWDCVPAAYVGAPHLRDRVWIIAQPIGSRRVRVGGDERSEQEGSAQTRPLDRRGEVLAHTNGTGLEGSLLGRESGIEEAVAVAGRGANVADAERERPSGSRQPVDAGGAASSSDWEATEFVDGRFADQWRVEPDVGRVAHGVPARVDRLRSLGNAVVPQVVEMIGRQLLATPSKASKGA